MFLATLYNSVATLSNSVATLYNAGASLHNLVGKGWCGDRYVEREVCGERAHWHLANREEEDRQKKAGEQDGGMMRIGQLSEARVCARTLAQQEYLLDKITKAGSFLKLGCQGRSTPDLIRTYRYASHMQLTTSARMRTFHAHARAHVPAHANVTFA